MSFSLLFLQKIYRVGFLLVPILVALDLLAFFYFPDTLLSDLFNATREQTPLTWLSALAMFFLALASLSIYYRTKEKIWYFLSAVFFFFSLDDAVYLHERVSGYLQDHTLIFDFFPSYIWVLIYFPLLIFSLGALVYLLWRDAIGKSKKRILVALFLLGTAIFLDLVDGFVLKDESLVFCLETSCHLTVLHLMRLSEEVLEVVALGILGYFLIREHCLDNLLKAPLLRNE
ncbi:MAG: hypothetical protein Q8Q10_01170 [bacterium]|nr:hypothetical protein [bacterium]